MMSAWRADAFPASPRRDVVLFATTHHDDGWMEVDRSPLVDEANGRLLDFIGAPDEVRLAVWPRAVARLRPRRTPPRSSPSTPCESSIPIARAMDLRAFFAEMQALRDRALADAAPLTLDDLVHDYFFVGMGDTLSLTFCNAWTEPRRLAQYRHPAARVPADDRPRPIRRRGGAVDGDGP